MKKKTGETDDGEESEFKSKFHTWWRIGIKSLRLLGQVNAAEWVMEMLEKGRREVKELEISKL